MNVSLFAKSVVQAFNHYISSEIALLTKHFTTSKSQVKNRKQLLILHSEQISSPAKLKTRLLSVLSGANWTGNQNDLDHLLLALKI